MKFPLKWPRKATVDLKAPDGPAPVPAAPVGSAVATAANDITVPNYTSVLRPTDDTLIQRGGSKGIQLYREVLRDGRAYTVLQKRKGALVAREWQVNAASDEPIDQKAADIVRRQLMGLKFDRLTLNLLDATLMGFAASEIIWERDGFEVVAAKANRIDQRRVGFLASGEPRLLTYDNLTDGVPFGERKVIIHRFEEDPSDPYGIGLGRILFWHVLFKREGVAFWLKALERFAAPLPIAKSPFTHLPGEQQKLLDVLAAAVVNGAIVVPTGTDIEFAKAQTSGALTHGDWCEYWDDQTSETVLGENLTTSIGDGGSKAASQVHMKVKDELVDGDADLLTATLDDTLVRWIVEYNCPDAHLPTVFRVRTQNLQAEETAKQTRATRRGLDLNNLFRARAAGFAPPDVAGAVTEIFDGQPFEVCAPVPDGGAQNGAAQAAALTPPVGMELAAQDAEHDHIGDLTDDLDAKTRHIHAGWIDTIRAEIAAHFAEGGTLDGLSERIDKLELPTGELATLMAEALGSAAARGRDEIKALD